MRYEELVADAPGELRRIASTLAEPTRRSAEAVAEGATIPKLAAKTGVCHHFWQGKPGLWKRVLTATAAERIALAQAPSFAELRYVCDPDRELTTARANANWLALVRPQTTKKD